MLIKENEKKMYAEESYEILGIRGCPPINPLDSEQEQ
jgi:hypothetical protein